MQMQATLAHCPNVGKFSTILYSFFDSPHWCYR
jgi:hypothetical protein